MLYLVSLCWVAIIRDLSFVFEIEDVEVERLLMEIENEFRLLSFSPQSSGTPPVSDGTTKQHDIDTEVALQPLRSENSDLRR